MSTELHIQVRPGVYGDADEILADFPFEEGQSIVTYTNGVIIIDLGEADDSSYVQDWYLNNNEEIQSFYVVED